MYHLVKFGMFLWKWLYCSWAHRWDKCHPRDPSYWHCTKCHPCGESFDLLMGYNDQQWDEDGNSIKIPLNWKQQIISDKWKKETEKRIKLFEELARIGYNQSYLELSKEPQKQVRVFYSKVLAVIKSGVKY